MPVKVGPTRPVVSFPATLSSGAFPAVPDPTKQNQFPSLPSVDGSSPGASGQGQSSQSSAENQTIEDHSVKMWRYIIIICIVAVLVIIAVVIFCLWRTRQAKAIGPWKTGISGQLQKAFVTGNVLSEKEVLFTALRWKLHLAHHLVWIFAQSSDWFYYATLYVLD